MEKDAENVQLNFIKYNKQQMQNNLAHWHLAVAFIVNTRNGN